MTLFSFSLASIYRRIVYAFINPIKHNPKKPPISPTAWKVCGVARIPMPKNTLSIAKQVPKSPTVPFICTLERELNIDGRSLIEKSTGSASSNPTLTIYVWISNFVLPGM